MTDVVNPDTYENLALSERDNGLYVVTLNRPSKRNALDVATIEELIRFFSGARMAGVKAVVLAGEGDHFCAGLDLVEHWKADRSPDDFMHVCLRWHEAFNKMEYGGVPIIAALKGAVVGGGLELASAAHVRVIDPGTYFALPEGQRGIFTGGGATIRVSDMIGKYRMIDMILTGRVYQGQEAVDLGLAQYIVEDGASFDKAMELAEKSRAEPAADEFRHLLCREPHEQYVRHGRRLCGGRCGRGDQHPARGPRTVGSLCQQDRCPGTPQHLRKAGLENAGLAGNLDRRAPPIARSRSLRSGVASRIKH